MTRFKRMTAIFLLLCLLAAGAGRVFAAGGGEDAQPTAAQPQQAPEGRFAMPSFDVPAKEAILIAQDTGDVLYQKNPDARVPIASITAGLTIFSEAISSMFRRSRSNSARMDAPTSGSYCEINSMVS